MKRNEPLSKHTTFKIGGPAEFYVEPKTVEEIKEALRFAKQKRKKFLFLGNGSNLLVSDKRFNGVVIRPRMSRAVAPRLRSGQASGESVEVESGVSIAQLLDLLAKKGLTGLEFMTGIPGCVGGAVAMNAGVGDRWLGLWVVRVWALDKSQNIKVKSQKECKFGYRKSVFQKGNLVITKVEFKLKKGNPKAIKDTIKKIWKARLAKQPYDLPSAGSFFKNPKGKFAGQLIDEAGCKGMRVGDAEVSTKHGNFIVNRGKARASDVLKLANRVQRKVKDKFGIKLQPEVKVL
ncbi:MAG: UDP-N-acetylmuramate dehydrogenase [Candidatus Margulisiibacteriota bacterium]